MSQTDIYERYNLYILPEKFYIEPRDRDGAIASEKYLEIDRLTTNFRTIEHAAQRIPVSEAELKVIFGVVGIINLVSGPALIVITRAEIVGYIMGHEIWGVRGTAILPYRKTTLHLSEKQIWYNRHFSDMVHLVLSTPGFYFSYTFDLSRNLQWLSENATPEFRQSPMIERADHRFVWNAYLLQQMTALRETHRYALPLIHGYFGVQRMKVGAESFNLMLVSRRSCYSAGVRFYKRGVNAEGHPANFVETEQIVEVERNGRKAVTAFIQLRGSIPLLWSQRPNLRWQPCPTMKPTDDQLEAYVKHFQTQKQHYGGKHVIVSLVNQTGREKRVGGELERVSLRANLPYVRYHPFDFHKECKAMQWHRLSILRDQLREELQQFGFFGSTLSSDQTARVQTGFFRSNCMDCLDRTNVVQSMLARESLTDQLISLKILRQGDLVEDIPELETRFKNLWADNGDECSKQYAGTGALKSDYTRLGKRTYMGAVNDGINAVTRYFRNNFADGYRQDAIDLFLGNFKVDPHNLPSTLETTILTLNLQGVALLAASFAMAMTVLCVLVAESFSATLFWLFIFFICIMFIFLNGEDFVNTPKLKKD